ncbi:MAG: Asp-tRNA(Asn)/Glu-tRNA(Gln) amidotransferase subunit GatA [Deltaproteobacteria bacterium]|nr:Asp-tRNA(Asn)/Glu-tRNA(Gln) amidotransferase subunit GatA [Deltaproteobacteria bacterium]
MTEGRLHTRTLVALSSLVASGEISSIELTRLFLDRIGRFNGRLNAFLTVDPEYALAQAAAIDRSKQKREALGPLSGVPIAVKDNICTRGIRTTCASRILENYIPPYDAHVVQRLRKAGAVIVGKLNMDEFAMGSSNENSAFGPVRNPWSLERTPGGSSGGPAAATASSLVAAALGSDTGGSVRQPASFCGITALKPTYGRVSRYGLVAFASSLDQIAPITRDIRDAARLLGVIAGHDSRDATSYPGEVENYEVECGKAIKGMRVGVVRDAFEKGCDEDVASAIDKALETFKQLGCELVEVSLPHISYGVSVYYIVAPAEASSNLARFDSVRYGLRVLGEDLFDTYAKTRAQGFGAEVKRRIMLGTYALSAGYYDAFYLRAQKVRTLIWNDYAEAFKRCDVLLTPTAPTPAFKLGEKTGDPLAMYLQDIFTLPPSLAGIPAVSAPCGFSSSGLPIGMQLCAPAFHEGRLVRITHAFEQSTDFINRRPAAFELD